MNLRAISGLGGDSWGDEFEFVYSLEPMPEMTGETTGVWNTYPPAGAVAGRARQNLNIISNWLSVANLDPPPAPSGLIHLKKSATLRRGERIVIAGP
ncbi:MAG: hypothetical protein PHC51_12870 [bacterium]|nr:hypothetical protein [bacterium]